MGLARVIAAAVVGFVVLPVVINVATGGDAPKWAIPAVLILGAAATGLAVAQYRADRRASPGGQFPAGFRERALRKARSLLDARLAYRPAIWARIELVDVPERVRAPDELTVVDERVDAPDRVWTAFEEASRSLLLLGAPGAGKTTQLLDLADRLLTAAEADGTDEPIPVMLDLSSFRPARTTRLLRRRSTTDDDYDDKTRWLARSLRREYGVGRQVAEEWLAAHRLVLLLDGLDEVPPADRQACVRSINHLQRRFRVPPIVVCSRDLDYAETGEKLALQRAVLIAPLYRAKVVAWLDEGGPALDHVRHAIDDDPTLWDLLDAPLWLDVLAAVSEPSRGESRGGSVAARRTALLDAYVDEALRRGDQSSGYTRADVVRWLGRLAGPGDPVVASRLRLGVVRITDRLPADAVSAIKVGFAGPLMTLVALAGAVVMLRHAGAVVAVTALAAALITVLVWRLAGKRPVGEPPRVRPAGLLGLCAAVTLLGTGLSAVALAITKGLSTLVGLFPGLPKSIDWISVLVVLLTVAVILGCIWAAAMSLDAYRSSKRPAQLLQTFAWAARGTVVAIIVLAVAGDVLGLGYVALISVSARYLFTGACALAFFAVGGAVGIVTDTLSGGEAGYDSQQEHWVASLMAVAMLAGVLITAALHRGWIPRALVFQLVAGGTGAGIGLFLAAQCRRLHLGTLATLCLASVGYLPWRLNRFLRYAARHDLLRSEGRDYRLRHQLFAEHFADRPNPRPPLSLVSPRK